MLERFPSGKRSFRAARSPEARRSELIRFSSVRHHLLHPLGAWAVTLVDAVPDVCSCWSLSKCSPAARQRGSKCALSGEKEGSFVTDWLGVWASDLY